MVSALISSAPWFKEYEQTSHLGLYFACHINGPAEFPMQYADSIIAFVVIRLVCPAVTLESQDRDRTKPVVPTPTCPSNS